ncbi:MAG: GHKL domain-containing protein [Eubacteriales bacterium]|nr:GHKL domain-containing protein [Eubacteriales bacterium]
MKNRTPLPRFITALLISILVCIPCTLAVFYYTQPMKAASYNLSLFAEDGQEWEGNKGWTIFTDSEGKRKELEPDGVGGYSGLDYDGQTFYFSREMTEELDSPTLQIGTANRTISIFLDDTLIYTDCPELDNRIGYLKLPMLDYDRAEPVTVSLPPDFQGHTLTIAQSNADVSGTLEKPGSTDTKVYPSEVTLYCGYSYESGLIAGTARTMIPAVLLFALILFLLAAFLWNASFGVLRLELPFFALTVCFEMCSILAQADFFQEYFETLPLDLSTLFFLLSVGALLAFLTLYAKGLRPLFICVTLLQLVVTGASGIIQIAGLIPYGDYYVFIMNLPQITGFATLTCTLVCAFFLRHKKNRFFLHISQAVLVLSAGYALFLLVSIPFLPDYASSVFTRLAGEVSLMLPKFSLKLVWNLCLISSLFAVVADLLEQEMDRRTEKVILAEKNELAIESYEHLRRQSEEVQMLRHDTARHYTMISRLAAEAPEKLPDYINNLITQTEAVRPVVATGNRILDIILNGKLSTASDKGIPVEIIRSGAPEELPLRDTETCCLFMNILDNAINAASSSNTAKAFIRLDFHCRDNYFVFSCENSIPSPRVQKEKSIPGHGYGLKIIQQIMKKWGNMISIEQTETVFKVSLLLPLP